MRFAYGFGVVFSAVLLMASTASAGCSITAPTGTDVWNAGDTTKSVIFTYDRGCSGGTAKLYHGSGALINVDWQNNFGAQSGSPVTIAVGIVPNNGTSGQKNSETCSVEITQSDGTQATDQVAFKIQN